MMPSSPLKCAVTLVDQLTTGCSPHSLAFSRWSWAFRLVVSQVDPAKSLSQSPLLGVDGQSLTTIRAPRPLVYDVLLRGDADKTSGKQSYVPYANGDGKASDTRSRGWRCPFLALRSSSQPRRSRLAHWRCYGRSKSRRPVRAICDSHWSRCCYSVRHSCLHLLRHAVATCLLGESKSPSSTAGGHLWSRSSWWSCGAALPGVTADANWRYSDPSHSQFSEIVDAGIITDAARFRCVGASGFITVQEAQGAEEAVATTAERLFDTDLVAWRQWKHLGPGHDARLLPTAPSMVSTLPLFRTVVENATRSFTLPTRLLGSSHRAWPEVCNAMLASGLEPLG